VFPKPSTKSLAYGREDARAMDYQTDQVSSSSITCVGARGG
jgi:hypothetical protein